MREGLLSLLQSAFRIRPDEARRTGIAFVYLFCAIGAFILGRIARTVLFLEIPNYREQLPIVYIGIAFGVTAAMLAYARVEGKLRRDRTNAITLAILIVITFVFRLALDEPHEAVLWAFYVWIEVIGAFLIVQFWTLTNELFNSRQAKRVFAFIGGGGVLANVVFGLIVRQYVAVIGTENLLYLLIGCLAAALAAVLTLGNNSAAELTAARERRRAFGGKKKSQVSSARRVFATRHVQFIAGVIVLTYLVSYLVDYQLNIVVGDSIEEKYKRSEFFASFFLYTGIVAGVVQFGLTRRILERFGVLVALLILPSLMIVGSVAMLTVSLGMVTGLWAAAFTKGSENVFRYTVNDTTLQLLYLPLPTQLRGRAKAVIDGVLKPVSIGAAGVLLVVLVGNRWLDEKLGMEFGFRLGPYDLSWLVGTALLGWIVTLLFLRREYLKSLLSTLQRRRLNLDEASFRINDPATIQVIDDALSSSLLGDVLHALEMLPNVTRKLRPPLDAKAAALLNHEADQVRVAALKYLGDSGSKIPSDEIASLLDDPSAEVRASTTLALLAIRHGEALGQVHHMLEDPSAEVRAHAIAGLIRHGGLDGVLSCADLLKKMLSSDQVEDRERAAWVLGKVGVQNFYQPLIPLLADPSDRVRHAAIIAAGQLKSPELIPHLVAHLNLPRLGTVAVGALASYGETVVDVVADLLADPSLPARLRAHAPRVLARLQHPRGVEVLCKHLLDDDVHVRGAAIHAVVQLVHKAPGARLDLSAVKEALRVESHAYFTCVAIAADLQVDEGSALLTDALDHRQEQAREHILSLLALKYPTDTIDLVSRNLKSSQVNTRANAVEVLDNLLAKDEKLFIIPLLEDIPADRKLAAAEDIFGIERTNRVERLTRLLESDDDWLQCCAAVAVGEWKLPALEPNVRSLLDSDHPVSRQTAVHVLPKLIAGSSLRHRIEPLADDPVPLVSRYTRHVLNAL
ncbi:MAG: Npt1/Npt2 family nucleotide transporter [Myxococcota bacterium]